MPKPQLYLSASARSDLDAIEDYIALQSDGVRAARVVDRILSVCEAVASMPGIGRDRPDIKGHPRVLPVRPWLIFYEPLADRRGVLVTRIVDGRRDLTNLDED